MKIRGYCPMGCGESLIVGQGGYLVCGYLGCPRPTAIDAILCDQETEHIVVFGDKGFDIQHPLRERAEGELFDCGLHAYCSSLKGPPTMPGRYRAISGESGGWLFHPIESSAPVSLGRGD